MSSYSVHGPSDNVSQNDRERLQLIEDCLDDGLIDRAILVSLEPDPTAVLVFDADEAIAVCSGAISEREHLVSKHERQATGKSFTYAIAGAPSGLAALLRRQNFGGVADQFQKPPPAGMTWVACVAKGGVSLTAISIGSGRAIGNA